MKDEHKKELTKLFNEFSVLLRKFELEELDRVDKMLNAFKFIVLAKRNEFCAAKESLSAEKEFRSVLKGENEDGETSTTS